MASRRLAAIVAAALWVMCTLSVQAQSADVDALKETEQELRNRYQTVRQQRKLLGVFNYLNNLYVDQTDMAPLVERAIVSMLEELDPHSSYIPAEEMKGVREQFDGEFSGIGIEFNIHRDTIFVVNVIAGAPAEAVGLRPNDRIVEIDGVNAVGISRTEVTSKLRGKTGSKVDVGVIRHGSGERSDFEIVRGKIPINTVDAAYKIDPHTAYIKVNRFGHTTMNEFEKAMQGFGDIDALVLDLRGNGGGIMEQAVKMAGFFLPAGSLIVSTEGANVNPQRFEASKNGPFRDGRVAVLIDEDSASASEIVAGALQDWDRAVIVGAPSFGKGLVQRQVMLPDSSAVRITVARYHTPTGRVIQRPYEKGKRSEYFSAHRARLHGCQADSLAAGGLPSFRTLRNGRTVFGGGGITPDTIVARDTTLVTDYIVKMTARGMIIDFLYSYLDHARDSLAARYDSFDKFDREYEVDAATLDDFFASGADREILCTEDERPDSERFIRRYMKAYVARMLFSNNEYWRVLNGRDDAVYRAALDIIGDPGRMNALLKDGDN